MNNFILCFWRNKKRDQIMCREFLTSPPAIKFIYVDIEGILFFIIFYYLDKFIELLEFFFSIEDFQSIFVINADSEKIT